MRNFSRAVVHAYSRSITLIASTNKLELQFEFVMSYGNADTRLDLIA